MLRVVMVHISDNGHNADILPMIRPSQCFNVFTYISLMQFTEWLFFFQCHHIVKVS